jgi:hypothetical protein
MSSHQPRIVIFPLFLPFSQYKILRGYGWFFQKEVSCSITVGAILAIVKPNFSAASLVILQNVISLYPE